jgi:hypothetical protein
VSLRPRDVQLSECAPCAPCDPVSITSTCSQNIRKFRFGISPSARRASEAHVSLGGEAAPLHKQGQCIFRAPLRENIGLHATPHALAPSTHPRASCALNIHFLDRNAPIYRPHVGRIGNCFRIILKHEVGGYLDALLVATLRQPCPADTHYALFTS